jgi:ribose 5-phosphate isomerase B
MKIYIGADHNGFAYKKTVIDFLIRSGHEAVDAGDKTLNLEDDFPQFAAQVVAGLRADADSDARGILIMAANRFKAIRACLCWNSDEARASRNDDDSNVLCLSARYSDINEIESIITTWLSTPFAAAPRFVRRLHELDMLE